MARGDQLGRQWKIIQTLVSARKGKSAALNSLKCSNAIPEPFIGILKPLQVAGLPIYTDKEYGKFKRILSRVNDAAVNRKSIEIVYFTMRRINRSPSQCCFGFT